MVRFLQGRKLRLTGWNRVPKDAMSKKLITVASVGYGGQNIILGVDQKNNSATILSTDSAAFILRDFLMKLDERFSDFYVTHKRAIQVIEAWKSGPPVLQKMPKLMGFKSDPDLVMTRLDFDPIPCSIFELEDRAPVFASMIKRMPNNGEALMARIGSIFDPNADRKQAAWVYGKKDAGKSQIIYILQQLCPDSFAVVGADDYRDKNFKAQFLNKRICIVLEASASFIRNDVFKSLTGDGIHSINQKYMPTFNAELPVLIFCFSNDPPEIPNDDSLTERVIACKINPVEANSMLPEHQIRDSLKAELPVIIGACFETYQFLGGSKRILCNKDDLTEAVDSYEEKYADWLENTIQLEDRGFVTMAELNRALKIDGYRSDREIGIIKRVLFSRYPVRKVRRQLAGIGKDDSPVNAWIYEGISLRSNVKDLLKARVDGPIDDGHTNKPKTSRNAHLRTVES